MCIARGRVSTLRQLELIYSVKLISYDADYPLEVDDEYWEHPDPEQWFKQPTGKPSLVTAFNVFLKLKKLLAFALRAVVGTPGWGLCSISLTMVFQYSINKSKIQLGVDGQQWEQHIVSSLNSALNSWVDAVPDHREPAQCLLLPMTDYLLTSTLGSQPTKHTVLPAISSIVRQLLSPPNHPPSTVYFFSAKALLRIFPLISYMHQRGTVLQPRC